MRLARRQDLNGGPGRLENGLRVAHARRGSPPRVPHFVRAGLIEAILQVQWEAILVLLFDERDADAAAHGPIAEAGGSPHLNLRQRRGIVTYFELVTTEIGRGNSHRILHIAVPRVRRHLDVKPDRSADMRGLL